MFKMYYKLQYDARKLFQKLSKYVKLINNLKLSINIDSHKKFFFRYR